MEDSAPGAGSGPATSPLACSQWSRSQHVDPVGSAGYYKGFLLVEQPLPWPADVSEIPELGQLANLAASTGLRLQAVVPAYGGQDRQGQESPRLSLTDDRRVICYQLAQPEWAGPLTRSEAVAQPASLVEVATALVNGPTSGSGSAGGPREVIDVLVCTHGRRDMCCGSQGMDLVGVLGTRPLVAPAAAVRLWRTSHTGGHRFAPTALVLPSATLWAFVDRALLQQVVVGEGALGDATARYRGCAVIGPPGHQAMERAALAEVGWPLLQSRRRTADLGHGLVRLETEWAGTWEALVREGRHVPQPECRTEPALAAKQTIEWVVDDLRHAVPA